MQRNCSAVWNIYTLQSATSAGGGRGTVQFSYFPTSPLVPTLFYRRHNRKKSAMSPCTPNLARQLLEFRIQHWRPCRSMLTFARTKLRIVLLDFKTLQSCTTPVSRRTRPFETHLFARLAGQHFIRLEVAVGFFNFVCLDGICCELTWGIRKYATMFAIDDGGQWF